MAEIFPPTRDEPFFEPIDGIDAGNMVITIRWATYFDGLSDLANNVITNITENTTVLQSGVNQLTGQFKTIVSQLENLIQLSSSENNQLRAEVQTLRKRVNDLEQINAN